MNFLRADIVAAVAVVVVVVVVVVVAVVCPFILNAEFS